MRPFFPYSLLRAALSRLVVYMAERQLAAFARAFDYDASYLREVLHASAPAFVRFSFFTVFAGTREGLTDSAWYGAKLAATLHEDCGPCTQLVVKMAERAGVAPRLLRACLARDEAAMGEDDGALTFRYASAVLGHDAAIADALRSRIVERFGQRGLVAVAFAIASSRVYPALKYALGHGRACERIVVGGQPARLGAMTEAHA